MSKLWSGRFNGTIDKNADDFNSSISFDKKMYKQDILGSLAHVKMLAKQGIISNSDQELITENLIKIREDIDMPLPHAINYIINYFNLPPFESDFQSEDVLLQDWGVFQRYSEIIQKEKEEEAPPEGEERL